MPFDRRQFERDIEAYEMSTARFIAHPDDFDPLKVAIDVQLALERYKINEEARAKAEVNEHESACFIVGSFLGAGVMYVMLKCLIGHV